MYTFRKVNNQWWFICNCVEKLLEYEEKTYHLLFRRYVNAVRDSKEEEEAAYLLAELLAMDAKSTAFEGLSLCIKESEQAKIACLKEGKEIWLNEDGGWNMGFPSEEVSAAVTQKMLLFPTYFEEDIRVRRFMGDAKGRHFYAYVGNIEVCEYINGEKRIKWDTYEEAYEKALRYCYKEESG
uniref:hypothetical protein n=1 Tax=Agathobacter sp. TaxID=2021311 RepID=UPI0040565AA2